jgi:IS30 family transposase
MGHRCEHLGGFERNFIQQQLNLSSSRGKIASALGRSASTVGREVRRNSSGSDQSAGSLYDAAGAGARTISGWGRLERNCFRHMLLPKAKSAF